ncbi:MAG: 2-oxoacid:acceptor oxidoreductase family protein [Coriobacteriia bacterium]|nr:2-oxoacid:acceptor oxidoreductase family protein [Coriobacteriia bacterium]
MSKVYNLLLAGFGGQGVLFAAKLLSYGGLIEGREVSWLPSYGPEMRGGTANCSVVLSEEPIGSPLVLEPDVLLAMNQPSYDKFKDDVVEGGVIIVDQMLVPDVQEREGVRLIKVPATTMAEDNDLKGLANVILTGVIVKESGCLDIKDVEAAIKKSISERKAHLLEPNIRALKLGYEFNDA